MVNFMLNTFIFKCFYLILRVSLSVSSRILSISDASSEVSWYLPWPPARLTWSWLAVKTKLLLTYSCIPPACPSPQWEKRVEASLSRAIFLPVRVRSYSNPIFPFSNSLRLYNSIPSNKGSRLW